MSGQIGWAVTPLAYTIKQGSSGAQRLTMTVLQANDDPLPSYDGWTCACLINSPITHTTAIELSPTVAGDADAHTLTVDLVFSSETTASLRAATYNGDIAMIDSDGQRYYPASIQLTIDPSYAL